LQQRKRYYERHDTTTEKDWRIISLFLYSIWVSTLTKARQVRTWRDTPSWSCYVFTHKHNRYDAGLFHNKEQSTTGLKNNEKKTWNMKRINIKKKHMKMKTVDYLILFLLGLYSLLIPCYFSMQNVFAVVPGFARRNQQTERNPSY